MASSLSLKKFDVFISFHGTDTRSKFTSHLYESLRNKVITFIDDKGVEKGDEISSTLSKAIEDSFASIVIFSKEYATSKWCLNELIKILECRNDQGQIVIPVFYEVDPSHVRYQLESYGQAFAKHEKDWYANKDELRKWRDALNEASYLAGWHSQNYRIESHFIKDIVKDILSKVNKELVRVEKMYQEISNEAKDIIEKTNIAKDVYVKAKHELQKVIPSLSVSYSTSTNTKQNLKIEGSVKYKPNMSKASMRCCESKDSSEESTVLEEERSRSMLRKGSPIIFIKAPNIKTATSVPCPKPNFGLVKPGHVGRIVSQKPKDVWVVRLSVGTYLIDGKYFMPLDLAQYISLAE